MLTEIYIEALLADEELADQVWEEWHAENLDDGAACIAWMLIAASRYHQEATANISSSSTGKSPSAPRMPGWSGRAGDFHGPGRFPKLSLRLLPC